VIVTQFQFLHLGIHFKNGSPTAERIEEVESVLNKAKDWFRYAPNCWLIYTSMEPPTWHERLQKIVWIRQQSYLIVKVDVKNKSGWLARAAWDWINQDRSDPILGSPRPIS
jgi:hypothetical protein